MRKTTSVGACRPGSETCQSPTPISAPSKALQQNRFATVSSQDEQSAVFGTRNSSFDANYPGRRSRASSHRP